MKWFRSKTHSAFLRVAKLAVAFIFIFTVAVPPALYAQTPLSLPVPGTMISLSLVFSPAVIIGVKVYPDNPLALDFVINKGDSGLEGEALSQEAEKLVRYFFAALTIPEDEVWVNLSPHEKDRIIPDNLGMTDMGKDMLAQDYLLKQITASLIYPEDALGKTFWDKVYKKAFELYGTTAVSIDTFNKVWIMPKKNVVYEDGDKAFVVEADLKVMLEEDYLAIQKSKEALSERSPITASQSASQPSTSAFSSEIVREVIIPELEKEINQGKNFAQVRQIYHSIILAFWFKNNLKNAVLNKVYSNQNKVQGINIDDEAMAQKIYSQYLEAFKKGVCNYIKVEHDPYVNKNIPRKYFSGGLQFFGEEVRACSTILSGGQGKEAFMESVDPRSIIDNGVFIAKVGIEEAEPAEATYSKVAMRNKAINNINGKAIKTKAGYDGKVQENVGRLDIGKKNGLGVIGSIMGRAKHVWTLGGSVAHIVYLPKELFEKAKKNTEDFDVLACLKDFDVIMEEVNQYELEGYIKDVTRTDLNGWDGKPNGCIKISFFVKMAEGKGAPVEIFFQNHYYVNENGEIVSTGPKNSLSNIEYDNHGVNVVVVEYTDKQGNIKRVAVNIGDKDVLIDLYTESLLNEFILFSQKSVNNESFFNAKAVARIQKLLQLGLSIEEIQERLKNAQYRSDLADESIKIFDDAVRQYQRLKSPKYGLVRYLAQEFSEEVNKGKRAKDKVRLSGEDVIVGFQQKLSNDRTKLKDWLVEIENSFITEEKTKELFDQISAVEREYEEYKGLIDNGLKDNEDLAVGLCVLTLFDEFIMPLKKKVEENRILESVVGDAQEIVKEYRRPGSNNTEEQDEPILVETNTEGEGEAGSPLGGIDFNVDNFDTEITGRGIDIDVVDDLSNIDLNNLEGLTPVIINIIPVTSFSGLFGLLNKEASQSPGQISQKDESSEKKSGSRYPTGNYALQVVSSFNEEG